ncbi:MAG: DUF2569 family protein [Candidatus Levybacteria bacterium]|nr:DUF2569 family protein [Candidatus Levybacteria bacterium]
MYCQKCGEENIKSAVYCKRCGTRIGDEGRQVSQTNTKYEGLGGWLALVGIGLIIVLLRYGYAVVEYLDLLNNSSVAETSNPNSSSYIAGYFNLLYFEFAATVVICGFTIYLLVLYFQKRVNFPKSYIYFAIGLFIYGILDYIFLSSLNIQSPEMKQSVSKLLNDTVSTLGSLFISNIIWISYMLKSERVRATFIN